MKENRNWFAYIKYFHKFKPILSRKKKAGGREGKNWHGILSRLPERCCWKYLKWKNVTGHVSCAFRIIGNGIKSQFMFTLVCPLESGVSFTTHLNMCLTHLHWWLLVPLLSSKQTFHPLFLYRILGRPSDPTICQTKPASWLTNQTANYLYNQPTCEGLNRRERHTQTLHLCISFKVFISYESSYEIMYSLSFQALCSSLCLVHVVITSLQIMHANRVTVWFPSHTVTSVIFLKKERHPSPSPPTPKGK